MGRNENFLAFGLGLWEELCSIRGLWDGPWCFGGDFNEILSLTRGPKGVGSLML